MEASDLHAGEILLALNLVAGWQLEQVKGKTSAQADAWKSVEEHLSQADSKETCKGKVHGRMELWTTPWTAGSRKRTSFAVEWRDDICRISSRHESVYLGSPCTTFVLAQMDKVSRDWPLKIECDNFSEECVSQRSEYHGGIR